MLSIDGAVRVYLAPGVTDMRKSIDTMASWWPSRWPWTRCPATCSPSATASATRSRSSEPFFQAVCFFASIPHKIARCKNTLHRVIMMDNFRAPPPCGWMTQLLVKGVALSLN